MKSINTAIVLSKVSPKLSLAVGRKSLALRKNAPHITFGLGLVGTVASTVLACRATLKLEQTIDEIQIDIDHARGSDKDIAAEYFKSAAKLGKLYAPALGVGLGSIALLSGSHVNLTRRNTSLMAAYASLESAYAAYRDRVRADVGSDREADLFNGLKEINHEGKVVKVRDPNGISQYARYFDEGSIHWEKDAELNRYYLQCQQNYLNDLLRARGHVFLNEVYDQLGLERSKAGQVVGWVIGEGGDNFIDFGMYDTGNEQFINGWEPRILLDFNVDGVVLDKF